MTIRQVKLFGTTDSAGDLVVTAEVPTNGYLHAIEWNDGTFVDGVDAVVKVTKTTSGNDKTLLTLTNANSAAFYYVRAAVCDESGAVSSYISTNDIREARPIIDGKLQLTVSSGGDTKTGGVVVFYDV